MSQDVRQTAKDEKRKLVRVPVESDIGKVGITEEVLSVMAGIAAMEDFYHQIEMPINMTELGISPTDEQITEMAERCRVAVGANNGSAMPLEVEDMIQIYKTAK